MAVRAAKKADNKAYILHIPAKFPNKVEKVLFTSRLEKSHAAVLIGNFQSSLELKYRLAAIYEKPCTRFRQPFFIFFQLWCSQSERY
jgi:hypothetical protein